MIIAHGVDIVEMAFVERQLADPDNNLLNRCFTILEQDACGASEERCAKLSGRLATKEAVMKALGTGFGSGVSFLDIETVNLPSGAPTVVLHRMAKTSADTLGITDWLVSTSHEAGIAIASVIAVGN